MMIFLMRVGIRFFRNEPLKRALKPDAATYWEEPDEQPTELERYQNQF